MPKPRTPTNVLRLRGSDKKHPERMRERAREPVDKRAIGRAPANLAPREAKAWHEITKTAIPGVLTRADRIAVMVAARLLARVYDGTANATDYAHTIKLLGQFGMTPSERSKVAMPEEKPANAFDEL